MKRIQLQKNLDKLLSHLDSFRDTMPMTILLLSPYQKKSLKDFKSFVKKNIDEIEDGEKNKSVSVKHEDSKNFNELSRNVKTSILASKIITESLFVSLLTQYDAFTNKLLKTLFAIRPECINTSDSILSFAQLSEFTSIEKARTYIIEKEIETVLSKSHHEQFDYIEKKLNLKLVTNLPIWKTFIEITQRRNLFVHSDGIVNSEYLEICKAHNCELEDIKLNQRLVTKIDYFIRAYDCLYELSTKLTHTIWRELLINDFKSADQELNAICFDLMVSEQYNLSDELLEYAVNQSKHYNESTKRIFIINRALSLYLQDKIEEAKKIIINKDWSASSDNFKLASLIIFENYEGACQIMLKIGDHGEVNKENYRSWPLFYKLRSEKIFKKTFKKIFNEKYNTLEIPKKPIQKLISILIKEDPELKSKTIKKQRLKKEKNELNAQS